MRDMKLISKIVNFYISCFTLICLLGLFFYLIALFTRDSNIFALYKGFSINGIVLPRMLTPFHSEPGPFGTFLVSSTLMAFILLRRKSFYIQLLSIFLTFSTLGIITLIISLVFYFSRKNIIYGLVFAFIFSSPLIFIKEIQPIFSWKIQQLIYNSAEHTKYGGRFAGMIIAPNMISEKPILGIGWENYSYKRNMEEYLGMAEKVGPGDSPSNAYLQIAAEVGILGLISLLLIFIIFLSTIWKNIVSNNKLQSSTALSAFSMIFALISASTLTFHYIWFLSGLTMALNKISYNKKI